MFIGSKENKKKGILNYLSLSLLVTSVVLLFTLIVILGIYVNMSYQGEGKEIFTYQSLEVKNDGKSVCSGFVSSDRKLGRSEYITKKLKDGYSIISNFGTNNYECRGTCSCDTTANERRNSIAKKSVNYFLAAVSTLVAVNIAKTKFHDVCLEKFSDDECSPSSVLSEVEGCDKVSVSAESDQACTNWAQWKDQTELEIIVDSKPDDCTKKVKVGDTVDVHYTGRLASNGEVFDSSVSRGKTFQFQVGVGMVIKGWDEGILGACEGESRRLIIPPNMGYGAAGVGPIPGGAVLIFDIMVVNIVQK